MKIWTQLIIGGRPIVMLSSLKADEMRTKTVVQAEESWREAKNPLLCVTIAKDLSNLSYSLGALRASAVAALGQKEGNVLNANCTRRCKG